MTPLLTHRYLVMYNLLRLSLLTQISGSPSLWFPPPVHRWLRLYLSNHFYSQSPDQGSSQWASFWTRHHQEPCCPWTWVSTSWCFYYPECAEIKRAFISPDSAWIYLLTRNEDYTKLLFNCPVSALRNNCSDLHTLQSYYDHNNRQHNSSSSKNWSLGLSLIRNIN